MFEKTKAQCDAFLEMGVPGFDFLVYKDGKEFFRYMGGYSDLEKKIPIRGDERRWVYSCTKLITVTCAMQQWEQGKFQLDDLLSDYLPAFREMMVRTEDGVRKAEKPIRIRHLFTMTAGFSYDHHTPPFEQLRCQNPNATTRQVIDTLAQDPLQFEPGEGYLYSLCHDVLAALIEVWSGQRYQDYVREHIFEPLGMENSTIGYATFEDDNISPLYAFKKESGEAVLWHNVSSNSFGPNYCGGGSGVASTTEDYMKFAEALRTGERLLKRSTIDLIKTNHLTPRQLENFALAKKGFGYGLGMWVPREDSLRQDFGWGGAAGALVGMDPGRGLSIVYMQHLLLSPNQSMRSQMVCTFLNELEDRDAPSPVSAEDKNYNLTY